MRRLSVPWPTWLVRYRAGATRPRGPTTARALGSSVLPSAVWTWKATAAPPRCRVNASGVTEEATWAVWRGAPTVPCSWAKTLAGAAVGTARTSRGSRAGARKRRCPWRGRDQRPNRVRREDDQARADMRRNLHWDHTG